MEPRLKMVQSWSWMARWSELELKVVRPAGRTGHRGRRWIHSGMLHCTTCATFQVAKYLTCLINLYAKQLTHAPLLSPSLSLQDPVAAFPNLQLSAGHGNTIMLFSEETASC